MAGCSELTEENFRKNKLQPEMFFDFNTTESTTVAVDYGEFGASTLVSIYDRCPLKYDEESGTSVLDRDLKPLFREFTDSKGTIASSFELPTYVKDSVFLYTSSISVPQVVAVPVAGREISYKYQKKEIPTGPLTRMIDWPYFTYEQDGGHAILNWWTDQRHGTIGDHNELVIKSCPVTNEDLTTITKAFWNGKESRPKEVNNSQFLPKTTDVNIVTKEDGVKIYFTFLTEQSEHLNSIGYYFYPLGQEPENPSNLPMYLIFPNASVAGNAPYGVENSAGRKFADTSAPVSNLTTVQLVYVGANNQISGTFPKDIVIGFFTTTDGWEIDQWENGTFKGYTKQKSYTNKNWNPDSKDRFVRVTAANYTVFGVEDGDNKSYEDILFTVQSDPVAGTDLGTADMPEYQDEPEIIDEDNDEDFNFYSKTDITYTYCYEDLWPVQGDYDMNDVVIDHRARTFFDTNNEVIKVIDEFTVCNRYKSAQVEDGFAVVIPYYQRGEMTLPEGAIDEKVTNAIILFRDAQAELGKTFKIVRDLTGMYIRKKELITDLDPFIIPLIDNDDLTADKRREVHMPKKRGTSKLDDRLIGLAQEAYFVDKDGKHPFAISIPLSVKNEEYILPEEMRQIDSEYPYFSLWVEEFGENYTGWYNIYR